MRRRLLSSLLGPARARRTAVVLVTDRTIAKINRDFLGHEGPTDVITFQYGDDDAAPGGLWGEIVISRETAARNARALGHATAREILHLVAHGALHLLGHDDATPAKRREMDRLAEKAVGALRAARKRTK